MIEQLKSNKFKLITEFNKLNHQTIEATKLKKIIEKKVFYFKTIVRAIETDKQKL